MRGLPPFYGSLSADLLVEEKEKDNKEEFITTY
jgi:hypothetical protein